MGISKSRSHVLSDWDPEDTVAWEAGNKRIARRNLIWSVAAEHVGFSIWSIWSVMVLFMPASVYGFSAGDKFLLAATADAGRSVPAVPLHVCHREVRRAQLDHILRAGVIDPDHRHHAATGQSRPAAVAVSGVRGVGRSRRWQLRLVHDKHQRVYPQRLKGAALA